MYRVSGYLDMEMSLFSVSSKDNGSDKIIHIEGKLDAEGNIVDTVVIRQKRNSGTWEIATKPVTPAASITVSGYPQAMTGGLPESMQGIWVSENDSTRILFCSYNYTIFDTDTVKPSSCLEVTAKPDGSYDAVTWIFSTPGWEAIGLGRANIKLQDGKLVLQIYTSDGTAPKIDSSNVRFTLEEWQNGKDDGWKLYETQQTATRPRL